MIAVGRPGISTLQQTQENHHFRIDLEVRGKIECYVFLDEKIH